MPAKVYDYSVAADTADSSCNAGTLKTEINNTVGITPACYQIDIYGDNIHITMKDILSSEEETILTSIVNAHEGASGDIDPPKMEDGRPIVRADTRPLNTSTYFTMAGDDSTSIGGGVELRWDFSNDDDLYTGPEVPSGHKAKQLLINFHCPINTKDGTIYFFDAPWGQYLYMDIIVPAGNYYPNPAGTIPASALGLSGSTMYAYASTNVPIQKFINKHFMYGSCPMGDELNSEGAAVDALPIGWYIRGLIITPNSDNISKGFGSLEMYRCHSELLPGQTIASLHG